jgi:hypothetical protein
VLSKRVKIAEFNVATIRVQIAEINLATARSRTTLKKKTNLYGKSST